MEDGIGEVAQLISVSFNGLKIGADLSLEALRLLKRMASILYHAMQAVPYRKTIGKTNMGNMKARMGEDLQYVSMSPEVYQKFRKFAKKSGILYARLPDFKGDGKIFIAVSRNTGPLLQEFLNSMEKQYIKSKAKARKDKITLKKKEEVRQPVKEILMISQKSGEEFKQENKEIIMEEYYAESGCFSVSDREFCERMARYYPDTFDMKKEMGNWQKKNLPMTEEQIKIEESLLRNAEMQLLKKEDSFILNFNKEQVVGMTDGQYKIYISNNICVWLDKARIAVSADGKYCRAAIENREMVRVSWLEENSPWKKIPGFGLRGWLLKHEDINERFMHYKEYRDEHLIFSKDDILKETDNSYLLQVPDRKWCIWMYKSELAVDGDEMIADIVPERDYPISDRMGNVTGYRKGNELYGKEEIKTEVPTAGNEKEGQGAHDRRKKAEAEPSADRRLITISKENIAASTEEAILFRVPYSGGQDHIWLKKEELTEAYGGKSYAYEMELKKNYQICDKEGQKYGFSMKGSDLLKDNFDIKEKEKGKMKTASKARKR